MRTFTKAALALGLIAALASAGCSKKESASTMGESLGTPADTSALAPVETTAAPPSEVTTTTTTTHTSRTTTSRTGTSGTSHTPATPAGQTKPEPIIVPAGTAINVKLSQTLSTASAKEGDRFSGHLSNAVAVNGTPVFPSGALVQGHVIKSLRAGGDRSQAEMQLNFDRVVVSGISTDINTTGPLLKAGSSTSGDLKRIGGGAAAGAVVGGILGGTSGAVKGAVVGGAAGTAASLLKRGKDLVLDEGTVVQVQLDRPVRVGSAVLEAVQR